VTVNTLRLKRGAWKYVRVRIRPPKRGGVRYDPTGGTVELAFVAPGASESEATYNAATWDMDPLADGYDALCLVANSVTQSGAVRLEPGSYKVLVRVAAVTERPIEEGGTLICE
jgi:hypothetical protein